jgi:chorismate-pyruvate lyase
VRILQTIAVAAVFVSCAPASAQEPPPWPDTYVGRLQALALVETINAEILASHSATLTLESWCREHDLAKEPAIVAELVKGDAKAPTAEQRQRLQVSAEDNVKYRKVQLRCGTRVLSDAENWYVPSRLTAAMNQLLETTDAPFGKVVRALQPYRQTFAVKILWLPLPEGWERGTHVAPASEGGRLFIPEALFEHQAVLYGKDNKPFSEVDEVYQRELLAFPPPR